jgi:hypothetical protein
VRRVGPAPYCGAANQAQIVLAVQAVNRPVSGKRTNAVITTAAMAFRIVLMFIVGS